MNKPQPKSTEKSLIGELRETNPALGVWQPERPTLPPPPARADITARPSIRRRRSFPGAGLRAGIPIVNPANEIVGWTAAAPVVEGGRLRHAEAERLLGGPIFCTQVALIRPEQIIKAGGPINWSGPWRCLALCRLEHARGLEQPASAPPR